MEGWRVLGIEESDGELCECCGTACPKRRVVLNNGDMDVRYGVVCAAQMLRPSGKRKPSYEVALREMEAQRNADRLQAEWMVKQAQGYICDGLNEANAVFNSRYRGAQLDGAREHVMKSVVFEKEGRFARVCEMRYAKLFLDWGFKITMRLPNAEWAITI